MRSFTVQFSAKIWREKWLHLSLWVNAGQTGSLRSFTPKQQVLRIVIWIRIKKPKKITIQIRNITRKLSRIFPRYLSNSSVHPEIFNCNRQLFLTLKNRIYFQFKSRGIIILQRAPETKWAASWAQQRMFYILPLQIRYNITYLRAQDISSSRSL